ncbi:MAG: alpha/beta hydrolase [Pseudomonadales bacterium]
MIPDVIRTPALLLGMLILGACQSQLLLMPTPEVLRDERFNVFEMNPQPLTSNELHVLYATTREPASGDAFFSGRPDDELHLGYADVRVGDRNLNLFELIEQSTTAEREEIFAWDVLDAHTLSSVSRPADREAGESLYPEAMQHYLAALNDYIESRPKKELTIYAHGANSTFYWSVAQAAQFQYFTGDNATVVAFSWPSPGSLMGYGRDKRRADRAATDLAYLIEVLAAHSVATRIHLLAYSAGGRVVGRALTELATRHSNPEELRIGQVYLTQSDEPLIEFVEALPTFFPLVEGLTVTAAAGDPVLSLARMTDGRLRLGAAGEGADVGEKVDEEVWQQVVAILDSDRMAFVDLRDVPEKNYDFAHGAWYESPWVSTDVMVTLLAGDITAAERGLIPHQEHDVRVWSFPEDYPDRVKTNLISLRAQRAAKGP